MQISHLDKNMVEQSSTVPTSFMSTNVKLRLRFDIQLTFT